jgi:tRNA-dihydrouridine synthase
MIWDDLDKPIFILAPMDDVTDTVFRRVVAGCAPPDLYFTEFASVDGFMSPGRPAVEQKLQFTELETPLIAQLWGLEPKNYSATSKILLDRGYAGIDINMGCPQAKIIKNGACMALSNNRPLAKEIIEATKKGVGFKLPISIKTRIGFNEIDLSWTEFLLNQKLDALIIHGRTAKQLSKVPNDWEAISNVVKQRDTFSPNTKIIGNGDILSRQQGIDITKKYKLDGVMIGRGIFGDPYVFSKESPWAEMSKEMKLEHFQRHIKLFIETWGGKKNPAGLKKFAKVYISGFEGASDMRDKLMQANSAEELLQQIS